MAYAPPHIANVRLLPEDKTQNIIVPRAIYIHTAVDPPGDTDLYPFFRNSSGAESTFYVRANGLAEQFMNTTRKANANAIADGWAISIETEDNSSRKGSNIDPFTGPQSAKLIELIRWLYEVHGDTIPLRVATGPTGKAAWGLGYHSMPAYLKWSGQKNGVWQNPWTIFQGKTCPGFAKISQLHTIIFPTILGDYVNPEHPTTEDGTLSAADVKAINDHTTFMHAMSLMTLTGTQFDPRELAEGKVDVPGVNDLGDLILREGEKRDLNSFKLAVNVLSALKKDGVALDDQSAEELATLFAEKAAELREQEKRAQPDG